MKYEMEYYKYNKATKGLIIVIIVYTLFFIIGSLLAPIFASAKYYIYADKLYGLLSASCSQEAMRSFWINGYQMAICSRCLGIYLGVIIASILGLFNKNFNNLGLLIFFILGFGEKAIEMFIWNSNNYFRLISGLFLGVFILTIILSLFKIKERRTTC